MKQRQGYIIMMLCAGLLLTLCSCGDDSSEGSEQQHTQELRVTFGSPAFRSTDAATTRASGDLPENFELYNYATSLQPLSQIQGYMTYDEASGSKYISCIFNHASGDVWKTTVPLLTLEEGNKYYFYGFMPKEDVNSSVKIEPYGEPASYAKGIVMTLSDLNAVTPNDICVIVGAKGYNGAIPDMSSALGKFEYNYDPAVNFNNLFLLVDHIYAGLQFNMKLAPEYATLRTIMVKSIMLIPEDGQKEVIETVDAVVTIVANNDNVNPASVVFPTDKFKRGKKPEPAAIYVGDGKKLTADYQKFMACLCPHTNTKFTLETTYDVYDRKNNKIREDQKAINSISLSYDLTAGVIHAVNITVMPTFLYMLSDPDLDNPTFVVD